MAEVDRTAVAWRLAAELARSRRESQAAAAVAKAAARLTGAEAVRVWMMDRTQGYRFAGAWPEETKQPEKTPDAVPRVVVFGTPAAAASKPPFRSTLVVPLMAGLKPMGAVELLEAERPAGPFTAGDTADLGALVEAADSALEAVRATASREKGQIEAITRLTRLFDIGRSLTATLDLEALTHVIVNRVKAALEVENVYLWLADDAREKLSVASAAGPAAGAVSGWELPIGEGLAGHVFSTNQGLVIDDPEQHEGLDDRPDVHAGVHVGSIVASPVAFEDGDPVGVIEVVNRDGEGLLDRTDMAFLNEVAGTAALALQNARRLDAEIRASDLGALLDTAQHLSSSLEVPKVSFTLVHKAAAVLHYKRAAVALMRGGKLEIGAVSGHTFVDETLPEMKALRQILLWAVDLDEGLYIVQEEDGSIDAERPETREKFKAYFEETGSRSFLTVPLLDEDGKLGVFTLESDEPYAFSGRGLEVAQLLAVQATIAIRNATLYQQIPMIGVFKPLARRKQTFMNLSLGRRIAWAAGIALAAALLVLVPFPLRVEGPARVLPARKLPVTAEVDGRVSRVFVREGDPVKAGQVLAALDDTDLRVGREDAASRYQMALREQNRMRAEGQAAGAAIEAARLEGLRAELKMWDTRLDRARIRATAAGVVATPRIAELVGTKLARGDVFCEVVDPSMQELDIAVAERDVGLVGPGMPVKVKLNAYPTADVRAEVAQIAVAATMQDSERVFLVRARLLPTAVPMRSGMTGEAKVRTGNASILRIVFRRPARWIWGILWGWLP